MRVIITVEAPVPEYVGSPTLRKSHEVDSELLSLATSAEHFLWGIYRGLKRDLEGELEKIRKAWPAGRLP